MPFNQSYKLGHTASYVATFTGANLVCHVTVISLIYGYHVIDVMAGENIHKSDVETK